MRWLLTALIVASLALSTRLAAAEQAASEPLPSLIDLPVVRTKGEVIVRAAAGFETVATRIAATAASELEGIHLDLEGLPRPPRVEIRLVWSTTDIDAASPHRGVPPWAVGVAFAHYGIVVAAQRRGSEILDIDNTVAHELAHLALGAALAGRAPRWLNEGFAYLHSSDWSFARFRTLVGMAWSNEVISLPELDASFPRAEQAAHRAYAQSYDFVAFLARRGRYADADDDGNPLPFRRFLFYIGSGKSPSEAAELAFGAKLHVLFSEWRGGLRSRYLLVPAEMFGLAVWCFGALILVIGFFKRRKQNRTKLAVWEADELAQDFARSEREAAQARSDGDLDA